MILELESINTRFNLVFYNFVLFHVLIIVQHRFLSCNFNLSHKYQIQFSFLSHDYLFLLLFKLCLLCFQPHAINFDFLLVLIYSCFFIISHKFNITVVVLTFLKFRTIVF